MNKMAERERVTCVSVFANYEDLTVLKPISSKRICTFSTQQVFVYQFFMMVV